MKTTFKTATILTSASLAALLSIAAAFHIPAPEKNNIASVTVSAKRMSAQQKQAFDLEAQGVQTVVISTKRLSPEQKLAMVQEDRAMQVALTQKRLRKQG